MHATPVPPPAQVHQNAALDNAAVLLGVSQEALITALTTRRIVAPGEVVIKLLKVGAGPEGGGGACRAPGGSCRVAWAQPYWVEGSGGMSDTAAVAHVVMPRVHCGGDCLL